MNVVNGLYLHPKMVKAAALLNGHVSHNDVFTLYVLGLSYAHHNLTDGYLPQVAVEKLWKTCAGGVTQEKLASKSRVTSVQLVTKVLSSKQVRLWHRRPGGWEIHDYLKHNPSASAVKGKREKDRRRQAAWRGHVTP